MSSFSSFLASFRPRTTDDLTHSSLLAPRLLFYTSTSSSSPQKQKHNKTVSFNTVSLSRNPLNIYISTPSNLISIHTAAQNNYNYFQSSMRGWVGATSLFSKRAFRETGASFGHPNTIFRPAKRRRRCRYPEKGYANIYSAPGIERETKNMETNQKVGL